MLQVSLALLLLQVPYSDSFRNITETKKTMTGTADYLWSIFIAALLGGAIGFEREYRSKEAGFRTHFLVGLGSALFMILSMHGFDSFVAQPGVIIQRDPARMAAQVVSGIGFIGAGCIIFQKNAVKGLTTAAGLWVTSAIGMTAATGMYTVAAASTAMVIVCLEAMNFIHHHIFKHTPHESYDADENSDSSTEQSK